MERGYTMIELIVVLGVTSVVMLAAISDLKTLENELSSASSAALGYLKVARTKAVGTTSAYRLIRSGPYTIRAETADSCTSFVWSTDNSFSLDLPVGTSVLPFADVCFGPRGFTDASRNLVITDGVDSHTVEVFRAGAVRVVK